jgi:hypothetical protein
MAESFAGKPAQLMQKFRSGTQLWRGSLLPLDREAGQKPANPLCQVKHVCRIYDGFAAEREQAPSPQRFCARCFTKGQACKYRNTDSQIISRWRCLIASSGKSI